MCSPFLIGTGRDFHQKSGFLHLSNTIQFTKKRDSEHKSRKFVKTVGFVPPIFGILAIYVQNNELIANGNKS